MGQVKIEILGRRYTLESDSPPDHIQTVASYVDQHLRELADGRAEDVDKHHAILAALNIASELFQLREQTEGLVGHLDARVGHLLQVVDASLADFPLSTGSLHPGEAVR